MQMQPTAGMLVAAFSQQYPYHNCEITVYITFSNNYREYNLLSAIK